MSCERAREIDLAAYLVDRGAAEFADFRAHYPRCRDCSRAMADWLGLVATLEEAGGMSGASHPSAAQLLAIEQDPGSCTAEERAAIRAHVAGCPQCGSELAVLRSFDFGQLASAPAPRPVARSLWNVLFTGLSRPAFAVSLFLGLLVAGVLAIPWFGGESETAPIPPVAVEERAPEPRPETAGEVPEPPPIPALPEDAESEPQIAEAAPPAPEAEPAPSELPSEAPGSPEPSAPDEPAPAEQPAQIAALVPAEPPAYHPDAALAGGSLESRRSVPVIRAGAASGLPEIRALAPEHVGATTRAAPTLYWFLSDPSRVPVEITLTAEDAAEPLLELRLEPPVGAGLHNLRLDRRGIRLEPGVTYRWFVALIPDPANRDADLVSSAAVRRAAPGSAQPAESAPAERAHALAAAGYWYDAFDTLTGWVQTDPGSERLREHRAALLEQVGLSGVAGLLSAPGDSSKPAADQ